MDENADEYMNTNGNEDYGQNDENDIQHSQESPQNKDSVEASDEDDDLF